MELYTGHTDQWTSQIEDWSGKAKQVFDLFKYTWFIGPPSKRDIANQVLRLVRTLVAEPDKMSASCGRIHVSRIQSSTAGGTYSYEVTVNV